MGNHVSKGGHRHNPSRSGGNNRNKSKGGYKGKSGGGYKGKSNGGYRGNNSRSNRGGRGGKKGHGQYIDPSRFVKAAQPVEKIVYESENTFDNFPVHKTLSRNLRDNNFHKPTKIQDLSLPHSLEGHDVVGLANTGTGKTAAFLLPMLDTLIMNPKSKSLIIAPTRELAIQIQQEARMFAKGARLWDILLIGGTPINKQIRALGQGPDIIIGTPGRIKDLIEKGQLDLSPVSVIALDEVDRMLDMGFINDIRFILDKVPKERQSLFFSATMSPTIKELINTFSNNPKTIQATTAETSDNVEQSVIHVTDRAEKVNQLHDLLAGEGVEKTIVFCETKHYSNKLSQALNDKGFKADAIHGNKSQSQRQRALKKFKDGQVDILVATDVAARGIDVDNVSHVINFDQPHTYDDYTHRIGRTGRGDKTGNAITFVEGKAPASRT